MGLATADGAVRHLQAAAWEANSACFAVWHGRRMRCGPTLLPGSPLAAAAQHPSSPCRCGPRPSPASAQIPLLSRTSRNPVLPDRGWECLQRGGSVQANRHTWREPEQAYLVGSAAAASLCMRYGQGPACLRCCPCCAWHSSSAPPGERQPGTCNAAFLTHRSAHGRTHLHMTGWPQTLGGTASLRWLHPAAGQGEGAARQRVNDG